MRQRAEKFLQDRRSILPLQDQFELLLRGKRYLPEHIATPLVPKLRNRIERETGLRILSQFVVKTPFPSTDIRKTPKEYLARKLLTLPGVPTAYGAYLGDVCRVVPTKLRRAEQLFRSFQLSGTTFYFFDKYIRYPAPCQCQEISDRTGLQLVDGHVLTRDFAWVTEWHPQPCSFYPMFEKYL